MPRCVSLHEGGAKLTQGNKKARWLSIKQVTERYRPSLTIIAPSMVSGVLVGTLLALFLPTISSLSMLLLERFASYQKIHLVSNPWVDAVVKPNHLFTVLIVVVISLAFSFHSSLISLLRRCHSAMVYDASVLWAACAFFIWRESRWSARILFGVIGLLLTWAIARLRTPFSLDADSFVKVDRPIREFSEDKLDRKPLILSLVKRLISDGAPVVALIGAYGDGKTSILYLLEEELKSQSIIVVRFKSSLPGDDLTLVSTLFNSIGKQLRRRFFVRRLRNVLGRFARRISGLVPKMPSSLKDIFSEPSQQDELQELTEKLGTLPVHRVVVLLDDMDRMQGSELRMLLKIIRATEDYPKLSFVCAFNKKALVDALIRHQVIDRITLNFASAGEAVLSGTAVGQVAADDTRAGYEYLEKFFPVQVPVPKLDEGQIGKEFDARFNQFAERNGLPLLPEDTAAFDKEFYQRFWKPYFLPFLTNLRKINSYFNSLNASFSLVKKEVNLIDFMCIELLRQVEPEVYEQVFRNRSLFYYPEWDILRWDERNIALDEVKEKKVVDAAFDRVFRNLNEEERSFVLSFLGEMFPKVNAYRGFRSFSSSVKPSELEADKDKRIYHPDHFSTYFSLHVQEGYVSSQELDSVIAGANEKVTANEAQTHFINYLRSLKGLKKYRFFEKMVRVNDKLGAMQAKALAIAVALEANSLAHDDFDMGEFGTAIRLIVHLTRRFKDSAEITEVLRGVIEQSSSDALVQRIFHFATEKTQEAFENSAFVDIPALKATLAARMKAKYCVGSEEPIYSPSRTFRDWQALLSWARVSDEERENVKNYLAYEFERWPASIGKHILWLSASIDNESGEKIVNDLFPLFQLAKLATKHGSKSYSTESEKSAVMNVIQKYGGITNPKS
jgi:predicted KAP-like P-loop ATPase